MIEEKTINSRKKSVVTGGAGFIGAHLCNELSLNGDVWAIDNLSSGNVGRLKQDVNLVQSDILSIPFLELVNLFQGAEVVYHLAAVKLHNEKNSLKLTEEVNILGTQRVALAAGIAGVETLVFSSSLYAYGNLGPDASQETDQLRPFNDYGRSKVIGEEVVQSVAKEFGLKSIIARLFFIYGPSQFAPGGYKSIFTRNLDSISQGKEIVVYGDGNQKLDYLYVSDCVDALMKLASSNCSGPYNVSSGVGISVLELVNHLKPFSSWPVRYDKSDWTAGTLRVGCNERLRNSIAWNPKISIEEGIKLIRGNWPC